MLIEKLNITHLKLPRFKMKMKYIEPSEADFVSNESFILYYLNRDANAYRFWNSWIIKNPDHKKK
ncbi:hypothetical protein DHW03_10975 [Pedobacter yonginense]|uniref:Uncharacterized protein n=1 Tax=Pedobacter yonginense TaxID=651869 RepID=A0A317EMN4_9SPHI|nr:hypothetical protein DHW03_10975 [Pedobacter yonginense]